jgi:disulfide bond formation protein DsbB
MSETDPETNQRKGTVPAESGPLAYRLVVVAVLCVTFMFIVVMVVFGLLRVFDKATQMVAALSSAFAVIGTLVGAYFGIKSSSEARNTVEAVHRDTVEPMQRVVQQATTAARQAADAAEATHQAAQQAAGAADATQQAAGAAERAAGATEEVAARR